MYIYIYIHTHTYTHKGLGLLSVHEGKQALAGPRHVHRGDDDLCEGPASDTSFSSITISITIIIITIIIVIRIIVIIIIIDIIVIIRCLWCTQRLCVSRVVEGFLGIKVWQIK